MIHVIATIEVAPGRRDAFLREFHHLAPIVRSESGCVEYAPTVDIATDLLGAPPVRPDTVVIVEKWESLHALDAHLASAHMRDFFNRMSGVMKGVQAIVLQSV